MELPIHKKSTQEQIKFQENNIILTEEDYKKFLESLLDPPTPNKNLKKLFLEDSD